MNHLRIDLISPNIKSYIEQRQRYLTCNPEYHLHKGSMTKSKLHKEVNKHSVSIEMVDFATTGIDSLRDKKREKNRCEKAMEDATYWGMREYGGEITYDFLKELGSRVEPLMNSKGYRDGRVRITNARISPPGHEKLDRELKIFFWENESLENPLEKALHAHFNIARIHPFSDGNGRTARLVQDVILNQSGLPLPVITITDRAEYISKIEEATYAYSHKEASLPVESQYKLSRVRDLATQPRLNPREILEGKSLARNILKEKIESSQRTFYDYLALKVFEGLNREIKRLYHNNEEMKQYFKKHK